MPTYLSLSTQASARSKLSFTTLITPRIMSKLSVASVNTRCDARIAVGAETWGSSTEPEVEAEDGARDLPIRGEGEDARETEGDTVVLPSPRSLLDFWRWCARLSLPARPLAAAETLFSSGTEGGTPLEVETPARSASRRGRVRINPLIRSRAGSGSEEPPAYLETTSTACRIV